MSEEEAQKMVEDITEIEIREAIKNLKNNKSPGTDGLPGEFYKCFVDDLVPILTSVFNYALSKNDPPHTWSEAIISVIHKDGKDPTQCEGYRPISLYQGPNILYPCINEKHRRLREVVRISN